MYRACLHVDCKASIINVEPDNKIVRIETHKNISKIYYMDYEESHGHGILSIL